MSAKLSEVSELLEAASRNAGLTVVLTGAGISAESGVPTFRGPEGHWTVGSVNYRPMELATQDAFRRLPHEVWRWYLHRRDVCAHAEPNAAHRALAEFGQGRDDFYLITQNVDGLHLRAGSSVARTFEIHGNISFMRCSAGCRRELMRVPEAVSPRSSEACLKSQLECSDCGAWMRPHVLWFDESYDEHFFRFESSLRVASQTRVLVVVGTTGATTLPNLVAQRAVAAGATLLVINPEPNVFSELAEASGGAFLEGTSGALLPSLLDMMREVSTH